MPLRNTKIEYGSVAKFFHWTIFVLVTVLIIIGYLHESYPPPERSILINIHKLIGLIVLLLVLSRLAWALSNPKPIVTSHYIWEPYLIYTFHALLYLTLIIMPISGWIMVTAAGKPPHFFTYHFPLPGITPNKSLAHLAKNIHFTVVWFLMAFVLFHILAALKHHFLDKDNVLKRML